MFSIHIYMHVINNIYSVLNSEKYVNDNDKNRKSLKKKF